MPSTDLILFIKINIKIHFRKDILTTASMISGRGLPSFLKRLSVIEILIMKVIYYLLAIFYSTLQRVQVNDLCCHLYTCIWINLNCMDAARYEVRSYIQNVRFIVAHTRSTIYIFIRSTMYIYIRSTMSKLMVRCNIRPVQPMTNLNHE